MMLPARHDSPPNSFTPRRWLLESRPLRDDPPAFLWAITVSETKSYIPRFLDECINSIADDSSLLLKIGLKPQAIAAIYSASSSAAACTGAGFLTRFSC